MKRQDKAEKKNAEIDTIESLVQSRRVGLVRKHLRTFLKRHSKEDPQIIFLAVSWLRRLGLFTEGFRLIASPEPNTPKSSQTFAGRKLLWSARMLNALGASSFAIQVLQHVHLETAEDFCIAGNIHLTNFDYAAALVLFNKMRERDPQTQSYTSRLNQLSYGDALAGVGQFSKAIENAREVLRISDEILLKAISHQALGEYLAQTQDFDSAIFHLDRSEILFGEIDSSPDLGFVFKWKAYVLGRRGDRDQSALYFKRAENILVTPAIRAEAWLDLLRLKTEVGLMPPSTIARLYFYPGVSDGFRKKLSVPGDIEFQFGKPGSKIRIDLRTEEFQCNGTDFLGLPLEIKLLAYLKIAGDFAVSSTRLKSLLWPDQAFSLPQLEGRLQSLLMRLKRHYELKVIIQHGNVVLDENAAKFVSVLVGPKREPSFLENHTNFTGGDFASFYQFSKTQTSLYLKDWMNKGWIHRVGAGPATTYIRRKRESAA